MSQFSYEAINEAGSTIKGELEATDADAARERLAGMGYIPVAVRKGHLTQGSALGASLAALLNPVRPQELILFTKQFKTMLTAGLSVVEILRVLERQTENTHLRKVCTRLSEDVKRGVSISEALAVHKTVFSPLYVSMVRAGEAAGALPAVLERLILIISHEHRVKSDIKSALQYPLTVVVALVGAFLFLLTYVVPVFARIFSSAHIELPLPTRLAMALNHVLVTYPLAIVAGGLLVVGGLVFYGRSERGKVTRDALLLALPIVGSVLQKAAMSRFAAIFAILQASGVPVLTTIDILVGTIGNAAIAQAFRQVEEGIRSGQGLAGPFSRARYFTPMVVTMVAVGEESGNLDEMLRAVSEHYDAEVSYAVKRLSDALGPILIVGLAGVVGFFALSIFLPMWDLSQVAMRR